MTLHRFAQLTAARTRSPFLRKNGDSQPNTPRDPRTQKRLAEVVKMATRPNLTAQPPRHVPHDRRKFMTRSEFDTLRKAIRRAGGAFALRDGLLVQLMWNHALRAREAVGLLWSDVLFDDGQIFVRRLKGSNSGAQYLNGAELRNLRAWKRQQQPPSRFVFTSRYGTPMAHGTARDLIMTFAATAGLPIRNPHSLRHGRAREAYVDEQMSVPMIATLLGHRDLRTTTVYLRDLGIIVPAARD